MISIDIRWFLPAWLQIRAGMNEIIYVDPSYLKRYYKNYTKKVEFFTWHDLIGELPEKRLEKADVILVTHHHKDYCKGVTVNRLKGKDTSVIATKY